MIILRWFMHEGVLLEERQAGRRRISSEARMSGLF
jgi:hypothetical protein